MNKQNIITVALKIQYGTEVIVPVCEAAQLFCQIAGTKTMTRPTLKLVRQLGYEVEIKQHVRTIEEFV